jgi:hypothetical protein
MKETLDEAYGTQEDGIDHRVKMIEWYRKMRKLAEVIFQRKIYEEYTVSKKRIENDFNKYGENYISIETPPLAS